MRVFVYATLKNKRTRIKAMHEDAIDITPAAILHFRECIRHDYPSLERSPGSILRGELLEVTKQDKERLDLWEERYHAIHVVTTDGTPAVAYVLKPEWE